MRFPVILVVLLSFASSNAQVRFGLQSGLTSTSEAVFSSQLVTTLSIAWQFENKVSWGLQYSSTLKKKINGSANFRYCDSLVNDDWYNRCGGIDSVVNSNIRKTYNINSLGLYIIKHRNLANEHYTVSGGVRLGAHFLSRQEERFDKTLDSITTDKAIGGSISPIMRISFHPNPIKNDFSIFVEGSSGIFVSPQFRCDDANCDNFLSRAINSNISIQVGIAF